MLSGVDFSAVFSHGGHSVGLYETNWGDRVVKNETGLLDGYASQVLWNKAGIKPEEARKRDPEGLDACIRRVRPDAILVNDDGRSSISARAIKIGKRYGARIVLRSTPYDLRPLSRVQDLARSLYLERRYRRIDRFCAVGSLPELHFKRFSRRPGDVFRSNYCVDEFILEDFFVKREEARATTRRSLGIGPDERVAVTVSRLIWEKDLDLTLNAFRESCVSRKTRLIVVGDGPEAYKVKAAQSVLRENLIWRGALDRAGVAGSLAAADFFLIGSKSDTWGAVLNEAIYFHRPIVSSRNVGGSCDLVLPGITGWSFRSGDVADCVAKIDAMHRSLDSDSFAPESFEALKKEYSAREAALGIVRAASS